MGNVNQIGTQDIPKKRTAKRRMRATNPAKKLIVDGLKKSAMIIVFLLIRKWL